MDTLLKLTHNNIFQTPFSKLFIFIYLLTTDKTQDIFDGPI